MSIADLNNKITEHRLKGLNLVRGSRELFTQSKNESLTTGERLNLRKLARTADDEASDEFEKAWDCQNEIDEIESEQRREQLEALINPDTNR